MKIKIYARNKEKIPCLKNKILKLNSEVKFSNKPEIIICFGGDGTVLHAEKLHPQIPKLIIRDQSICKSCNTGNLGDVLKKFFENKYVIEEEPKIQAITNNKKLTATNDIVIRNADQHHAIRFEVKSGKQKKEAIGDGVVIATPFGSTAYYNSITRETITKGIGIAFNNSTKKIKPINTNQKIIFKLKRNKAYLTSDNYSKKIILKEGDEVIIQESKEKFKVIKIKK